MKEKPNRRFPLAAVAFMSALVLAGQLLAGAQLAGAQGAVGDTITFQGQLARNGSLVDRVNCDFQFSLYDAPSDGNQLGDVLTVIDVPVTDGYFTADLDFGNRFTGDERYLQVGVRCPPDPVDRYMALAQRFDLTSTPFAVYARSAANAGTVNSAVTALNATNVITAEIATSVEWADILNRPSGLDDGDDDTLANVCPDGSAATDKVAKFDGTDGWTCEADDDVDTLRDLKSTCDADEIAVLDDGAWACAGDSNTTYTAGTGLVLDGFTMTVESAYRLPISCTNEYTAQWDASAGQWGCVEDDFNEYTAGQGIDATAIENDDLRLQVSQLAGTGLADDGSNHLRVDTAGIIDDGLNTDASENIRFHAAAVAGIFLSADLVNNLNVDANALAGDGLAENGGKLEVATGGVGMRELNVPMGGDSGSWSRLNETFEYKFPVNNIDMEQSGKCLVIATGVIKSPGKAEDSPHAYVQAAIRVGSNIEVRPSTAVSYFGPIDNADNATASWVFNVTQGDEVDFGCWVQATPSSWLDDENWTCVVSYFCR